jgi:hypothetical protein
MTRRAPIAVAVTALGLAGIVSIAIAQVGRAPAPTPVQPGPGTRSGAAYADASAGGGLKPCPADKAPNFDAYSLGAEFEGHKLTGADRVCNPPDSSAVAMRAPAVRDNNLTYLYGTCKVPDDDEASCPYPVSVQNFPACERNLSLYQRYPAPSGESVPYTKTTVRGVPAAVFDGGLRIEVYTGDVTVVVWGQVAAAVRRAATHLQGLHGGKPVDGAEGLPDPRPGAMQGTLPC